MQNEDSKKEKDKDISFEWGTGTGKHKKNSFKRQRDYRPYNKIFKQITAYPICRECYEQIPELFKINKDSFKCDDLEWWHHKKRSLKAYEIEK